MRLLSTQTQARTEARTTCACGLIRPKPRPARRDSGKARLSSLFHMACHSLLASDALTNLPYRTINNYLLQYLHHPTA